MFSSCKFYGDCIVTSINKISGFHLSCLLILFLFNPLQGRQGGREMFPFFTLAWTLFPKNWRPILLCSGYCLVQHCLYTYRCKTVGLVPTNAQLQNFVLFSVHINYFKTLNGKFWIHTSEVMCWENKVHCDPFECCENKTHWDTLEFLYVV